MKTVDLELVSGHWAALHQALGIGGPFFDEAVYERALSFVEQVFDEVAQDSAHPLDGLIDLLADRIREYEDRVHPWPDTSAPLEPLT
jgi:HTH-type transcriptional regulator / antitoxin HigA